MDSLGCSFSTNLIVEQPGLIGVVVEATDASCNVSSDGTATLQISGGTAPYEVAWTGPDEFEASGAVIENLAPGSYLAVIIDANGCTVENVVQIDFLLELSADAGSDQTICFSGQPLTIAGLAQGADLIFWTDTAGNAVGEAGVLEFSNSPTGTYQFVFTASNGVCEAVDSLEVTILQGPQVDAGPDIEVFAEQVFTLGGSPTAENAVSFAWSPSAVGDFNSSASNPTGFLLETATFTVTVIDESGCIGMDSVTVTVLPAVNISSGFTPNGDGVNDTWIIDNIELFPNSVVSVFSRWGTLIFQKSTYNSGNAWDGTYNGSPAPVGTYYYAIELNDVRYPEPFTGPLTIYR
jgi:gliding motility-associated-like protein